MENNNNNNKYKDIERPPTYDTIGLIIGACGGIFISVIGITNILMGVIIGMFLGLVIGSFIKK